MKTIEKILWHKPLGEKKLEELRSMGLYNWMWNDSINFDDLLGEVIKKLWDIYSYDKHKDFYNDIQELVFGHDIDYFRRTWKIKADWRLASGIYQISYWMPFSVRLFFASVVFFWLQSKQAYNTYNS